MSIIPIVSATRMLQTLLKAGFLIMRQKGSHIWLRHPITRKVTTVAMHSGDMTRKLITKIIKQAGIPVQDFIRYLRD